MIISPDGEHDNVAREVVELEQGEAMRLLASVGHGRVVFTQRALPAIRPVNHLVDAGRVVFTQRALPAIRPVNHLVDAGRVIVRTRLTANVATAVRTSTDSRVVVAYEADELDPQRRTGWSVVVTGLATTITNPEQIARYEQLLQPWVNMAMDTVIAIQPEVITGIRIVEDRHEITE